ncbi:hypothetical protein GF322_00495 [Candidatus Dependentiae bacterium]|nr:hypothetical protein [Candidatus Dependentiae bacterium]
MKKFIKYFFVILITSVFLCNGEQKKAEDVFGRWLKIQLCFKNINLQDIKKHWENDNLVYLKTKLATALNFAQTFDRLFEVSDVDQFRNIVSAVQIPQDDLLKKQFFKLYDLLQKDDLQEFVSYLKTILDVKDGVGSDFFIDECKDLMLMLFMTRSFLTTETFLFSVANKLFDYCFREKRWPTFRKMLKNENDHPVVRFIYSVMWWYLAGNGWKYWSQECLDALKDKANKGYEIIYIAGGSDIYQLIKNEIYNIRIIDPILPSQPKYYSEGWNWLICGQDENGIGDEIAFDFDELKEIEDKQLKFLNAGDDVVDKTTKSLPGRKVVLKRESFKLLGEKFKARIATGELIELDKSITVWGIYNKSTNEKLGTFTIERRFVKQDDLVPQKNKAHLISFNELYFICAPTTRGGWGINPYKFKDVMYFHVKQLHKHVTSNVMKNMRKTLEDMEFNYIALGTCIN